MKNTGSSRGVQRKTVFFSDQSTSLILRNSKLKVKTLRFNVCSIKFALRLYYQITLISFDFYISHTIPPISLIVSLKYTKPVIRQVS